MWHQLYMYKYQVDASRTATTIDTCCGMTSLTHANLSFVSMAFIQIQESV
jgi:hypothetical protein